MRAFVVLGLVFFTPSQEIGLGKRLRNDLFCVDWDVKPQLSQSLSVGWQEGHVAGKSHCASYLQRPKMLVGVIVAAGLARILTMTFCLR